MWARQLEGPWLFPTLHTVAPLAGHACVMYLTYMCVQTRVL